MAMNGINKCMLSGNLTRDAELRMTNSGMQILNFSIAVNESRQNGQGEWEDVPNYFDCVVFGRRAESLARYLFKGTKVCILGKLRYSTWQNQEGQRRSKVEVVVDELEFMNRQGGQGGGNYPQSAPTQAPNFAAPSNNGGYAPVPPAPTMPTSESDIPF